MAKKKAATTAKKPTKAPTEKPPANEHEAALVAMLKDLDNLGVQMVESDWRQLSDGDQRSVEAWIANRKSGQESLVPLCIRDKATADLRGEIETYQDRQQAARRVTLPCTFLKPAISAKDDDGNRRIKVSANIPFAYLRGGECDRLFRFKECRIEFSPRSFDQWDGLPGVEEALPPATTVVADLSGYHASRHFTKIGFLIDESDVFSKDDAFDLEGCSGSIRIEVLGGAKEKKSDEDDSEPEADDRPTLPGVEDHEEDLSGEAAYAIAVDYENDLKVMAVTRKETDGWYVDIDADTPDGWEAENDDITTMLPRDTPLKALETRLGQIVDHWQQWKDSPGADSIIRQLRQWLVELSKGTSPAEIQGMVESARNEGVVA